MVGQLYDLTGSYVISNIAGCISVECGVGCIIGAIVWHKQSLKLMVNVS